MACVLIISSHVAVGGVGGTAQAVDLAQAGVETIFAPTVLFGRHPGHGAPGGGPVDPAVLRGVLDGVKAQGAFAALDAVVAGYFPSPEHVDIAAATIDRVRAVNPRATIVVDPIMGDFGKGLYVKEAVADAIAADLVTRADLVAPNAWELERLTGRPAGDVAGAMAAAQSLGRPVLVSSVSVGEEIAVVYQDDAEAWLAVHRRAPEAPHGTGDRLTGLFVAALVRGADKREALRSAVTVVARPYAGADVRIERLR